MSVNSTTLAQWTILQCLKKNYKSLWFAQMFLFPILFLNGPIIFVLVRKRRRLSAGNTIILHLTVADCLLFLAAICYNFVLLAGTPIRVGNFFCQLTAFVGRLTYSSSVYFITIMAACRCYSVVKPFQYRANVRPSRINKICFGVWCSSLVMAVMPLIGWGEYTVDFGRCHCALDTHKYPYNWLVYCLVSHVLPLVANSVFISITASKFRNRKNKMKAIQMRHSARRKVALFKKTEIEPNVLSEGFHHVIALKEELEDKSFKTKVPQEAADISVEVKVEIHRAHSIESQDSSASPKKTPEEGMELKVEITNMNSEVKQINSDNKSIDENEDNLVITEVGRENFGMVESDTKQESQSYQEPLSLHAPQASGDNGNQANLESVVQGTRGNGENSEENMKRAEKHCQQGSQLHLESNSLHRRHAIRRPHRGRNHVHLESIAHLESIEKNEKNSKGQHDENQLKVAENHQGSQHHLETIQSRDTVTGSQFKHASKDLPILTIALVFASFLLFCSPIFVVRSLYALAPDSVPQKTYIAANFFTAVNSLANPFLYGLLNKEIRSDIKNLFCRF